jgi:hypothetical protein
MEGGAVVSDETKRRVAAAKSYIENMYKVQHQNIQERYARYLACRGCDGRRRALLNGSCAG